MRCCGKDMEYMDIDLNGHFCDVEDIEVVLHFGCYECGAGLAVTMGNPDILFDERPKESEQNDL